MAGPNAPSIIAVSQATTAVVVAVAQSPTTGTSPVISYKLYRSSIVGGPNTLIDTETISASAIRTNLFDLAPLYGVTGYYTATAIDATGVESPASPIVQFSSYSSTLRPGLPLSNSAFGPYPVLGSDVYLDPTINEGVVGPNGDLLTVNSLLCLAQDLRLRFLVEIGELRLDKTYGFVGKEKIIGSGQAEPQAMAQILRTDAILTLRQEPRVQSILSVGVEQYDAYSWVVWFDIMARNTEDAGRLNQVFPFFKTG